MKYKRDYKTRRRTRKGQNTKRNTTVVKNTKRKRRSTKNEYNNCEMYKTIQKEK
jgi:hypothetical protein